MHNVITTKINMGNQFNVRKENSVQTKGQKKSKGERLGWESLSGYRPVPLRTVVENVSLLKDMDTIKHFIETMSFVETTFGFERGSNNISENAVKVTVVASGFEKNEK